jgi:hypothetical protein
MITCNGMNHDAECLSCFFRGLLKLWRYKPEMLRRDAFLDFTLAHSPRMMISLRSPPKPLSHASQPKRDLTFHRIMSTSQNLRVYE